MSKLIRFFSLFFSMLTLIFLLAGCGEVASKKQEDSTIDHSKHGMENSSATKGLFSLNTKNVTRINQDDPIRVAVETSQTIWPATSDGNRPGTVLLGIGAEWKVNLPAVTLVHHPNNGPLLYAEKNQIPEATLQEIKRLNPTGSKMNKGIQVILIGDFANTVRQQLENQGLKVDQIKGTEPASMAKEIDAYYAKASGGKFPDGVVIGSMDSSDYTLPVANWIAHMPEPLLYVSKDTIPEATIDALKQRQNKANIYLLGPEKVVSKKVEQKLQFYGKVTRISGESPEENAIAFAKYKDLETGFGWGVTQPGHGLTFNRTDRVDQAIVSAPFAHLGKHTPMVLLQGTELSTPLHEYLMSLQPKFKKEPTEGPYNHAYVIGTEKSIPFSTQGMIDEMLEITSVSGKGHEDMGH
ncbi:cell wall-binding repeat-containing protein [Hazenella coriacea]|uniref:ArsR family transcriptional regulator n=1 Tax=Hazenella coriacea TaxID=1179467 RepID=A0A4V2UVA1_9BACL|nr:cell wall-binding repeat-containing protein [Hazenella coriacea]TCS94987.1 ArsR family transcriptional regulator [Hazenella coriacea]